MEAMESMMTERPKEEVVTPVAEFVDETAENESRESAEACDQTESENLASMEQSGIEENLQEEATHIPEEMQDSLEVAATDGAIISDPSAFETENTDEQEVDKNEQLFDVNTALMKVKEEVVDDSTNIPSCDAQLSSNFELPSHTHSQSHTHTRDINDRMTELKHIVETKSNILTNAWNELSSVLGEYKAELFSKQEMTQRYDSVSDIAQLKSELVNKDNEIIELRKQLDGLQRHSEQCQIDLSVKDSLLKKYQEDLLQKEAALLTSQSKVTRIENKLRALESRPHHDGPPRKAMRPALTPGRSPLTGRITPGRIPLLGVGGKGPLRSPLTGKILSPGLIPKRRMPTLQQSPQPTPRPSPSTQRPAPPSGPDKSGAPVICIEVDDDDELQEITDATQDIQPQPSTSTSIDNQEQQNIYMAAWHEQEDTNQDQFGALQVQDSQLEQSHLMDESQAGYSGDDSLLEQSQQPPWPVEMTQVQQSLLQQQSTGASNKFQCSLCRKSFSSRGNLKKHTRIIHVGVKTYQCEYCDYRCAQKTDLTKHLKTTRRHQFDEPVYS